jgi:hypothetical protein
LEEFSKLLDEMVTAAGENLPPSPTK